MVLMHNKNESKIIIKKLKCLEGELDETNPSTFYSIIAKTKENTEIFGYNRGTMSFVFNIKDNNRNRINIIEELKNIKSDRRFKTITLNAYETYKDYYLENNPEGETYVGETEELIKYNLVLLQKNYLNKKVILCLETELKEIITHLRKYNEIAEKTKEIKIMSYKPENLSTTLRRIAKIKREANVRGLKDEILQDLTTQEFTRNASNHRNELREIYINYDNNTRKEIATQEEAEINSINEHEIYLTENNITLEEITQYMRFCGWINNEEFVSEINSNTRIATTQNTRTNNFSRYDVSINFLKQIVLNRKTFQEMNDEGLITLPEFEWILRNQIIGEVFRRDWGTIIGVSGNDFITNGTRKSFKTERNRKNILESIALLMDNPRQRQQINQNISDDRTTRLSHMTLEEWDNFNEEEQRQLMQFADTIGFNLTYYLELLRR